MKFCPYCGNNVEEPDPPAVKVNCLKCGHKWIYPQTIIDLKVSVAKANAILVEAQRDSFKEQVN